MYHGLFVQDDWRVNDRAHAQLRPAARDQRRHAESDDRNLAGFDFVTSNPIEAAGAGGVRGAIRFPRSRSSQFQVTGGLLFADGP